MAEEPAGAIQRPSFCCHAALPSRSSGSASAIRALRTGPGNCFFSTTHALTTSAMAMMAYCRASEASMVQPAPNALATW